MRTNHNADRTHYDFDNVADLLSTLAACDRSIIPYHTAWDNGGRAFTGTDTFAEATGLARDGWPEGRAKMVRAMSAASALPEPTPSYQMDVAGAFPVAAYASAGDPQSMWSPLPVSEQNKPILRIAVNIWASSAYDPPEFTNFGAAVLSYVDGLEAAGYRVELTAVCHAASRVKKFWTARVPLKGPDEALDIDRVAYFLTHPSALRRLMFALMVGRTETGGNMSNCGTPRQPGNNDGVFDPESEIFIPGVNTFTPGSKQLKSSQAAVDALRPILEGLFTERGVTLPPLWEGENNEGLGG
jgi:hypothetical protein